MLAGSEYNEKLSDPEGRLRRLRQSGKPDGQIVEEYYLAAFGRKPEPEEATGIEKMIAAAPDRDMAWKDFIWALLCSREFAENH